MFFEDKLVVKKVTADDWAIIAERAHLIVFEEARPAEMNRISYALMIEQEGIPQGFATVRELDSESVYWQYGGLFPSASKSVKGVTCYKKLADFCRNDGFKRVTTYIENTNRPMLRMALDLGFLPIGIRNFKNQILLELLLDL